EVAGLRGTVITFSSGATEADNLAIIGMALGDQARIGARDGREVRAGGARSRDGQPPRRHIVTSAIEHEAVLAPVDFRARLHGFERTVQALVPGGTVTPEAL